MDDKDYPITFCFGDIETIKQAALFFDCVVPYPFEVVPQYEKEEVFSSRQVTNNIFEHIPHHIYNYLLHPISTIMGNPHEFGKFGLELSSMFKIYIILLQTFTNKIYYDKTFSKSELPRVLNEMKQFGFELSFILPEERLRTSDAKIDDISVMLSGIELIDTKSATWEQIIEFRDSEEAKTKLRNLRLFLQSNYVGKSRQYIEDDFGKRMDDYASVVKEFGFDVKMSALTFISNSKNIQTFGTASLAAALLGEPVLASASLAAGIGLEVLKATIEFSQKKHAFEKLKGEHELSYIIDFKKKIKK